MAARQPHRTKPRPGKSPYFTKSPRTGVAQIDPRRPHLPIFLPGTTDEEKTERRAPFMELFFVSFREHGTQNPACIAANLHRSTVTEWLRADVDGFRDRYREAQKDVNDRVEREIVRRGVEGYEEPVFQGGKQVGTIRKFDSRMLELYLKRHLPEYKESFTVDHNVSGGIMAVPQVESKEEWERRNAVDAECEEIDTPAEEPGDE